MNQLASDVQRLHPGTLMEFYSVDLSNIGGPTVYLHPGVNEFNRPVVWRGQEYSPFPMEADGYSKSTQGPVPRPRIRISNIGASVENQSGVSLAALEWGDLVGARVTKYVTLARYVDAVNFRDGNPTADPSQYFPPEIYFIDSKTHEDKNYIEFELCGATDLVGVRIPAQQVNRSMCTWLYRSEECGYTGGPCATSDDKPTSDPEKDKCGKRITSCRLRFGEHGELPCRIFPAAGQA